MRRNHDRGTGPLGTAGRIAGRGHRRRAVALPSHSRRHVERPAGDDRRDLLCFLVHGCGHRAAERAARQPRQRQQTSGAASCGSRRLPARHLRQGPDDTGRPRLFSDRSRRRPRLAQVRAVGTGAPDLRAASDPDSPAGQRPGRAALRRVGRPSHRVHGRPRAPCRPGADPAGPLRGTLGRRHARRRDNRHRGEPDDLARPAQRPGRCRNRRRLGPPSPPRPRPARS